MKGGEVSANQSKKTKPDKATFRELFIAVWKIKAQLENVSVRDENCKQSSGGHSLRGFRVGELLHTRLSWEANGIATGKLPSTMIIDQHGNETHQYMTMNGIIIDNHSPEFRNRTKQIIMFATSAMLPALAEIESAYNNHIEEEV